MLTALTKRITCAICVLIFARLLPFAHAYTSISDDTLRALRRPTSSEFDINTGSILSPILIPRIPGTENSTLVLQHLTSFFQSNLPDWKLELQNSTFTTPISNGEEIPFRNLIAYRDPPGTSPGDVGRLTLVAHYDSKVDPAGFIGAVDSAAPCAMILHAVASIDGALSKKWSSTSNDPLAEPVGIQVIFLDGEEAFQSWTATDSLYGARSLSSEWDTTYNEASSTYKTRLETISLFVLLDLLGASTPTIPSYFKTTHWAYQNLAKVESRLRSLNLFHSTANSNNPNSWLPDSNKNAHDPSITFPSYTMQDDHIPFMARGVEVLHLIPSPFPRVWHTINDDGAHLDMPTVEDWSVLMSAFIGEWMELEGFLDRKPAEDTKNEKVKRHVMMPSRNDRGKDGRWGNKVISKTEL